MHGEAFYIDQSAFHRLEYVPVLEFSCVFPLNIIKY